MKKQILILALFVLAALANVSNSFGQCVESPLTPIGGKPYPYTVTIGSGFTDVSYQWIVTKDLTVLSTGSLGTDVGKSGTTFSTTGSDYNSTSTASTNGTINITWAPELIADALTGTKYYVVVKYSGTNATTLCPTSNLKAWRIKPVNMFQLDLANIDATGTPNQATPFSVCPSPIQGGVITDDNVAAPTIAYDYGVNDLYFKVTVRNFTGAWNMTVNHDALVAAAAGTGESAKIYWGTSVAGATNEITNNSAVSIAEQNIADATTDEVIYLKLTVTHGSFEGLTAETFPIVVNATDKAANPDVSATCTNEDDTVTQIITIRPSVTAGATGPFITKNP